MNSVSSTAQTEVEESPTLRWVIRNVLISETRDPQGNLLGQQRENRQFLQQAVNVYGPNGKYKKWVDIQVASETAPVMDA